MITEFEVNGALITVSGDNLVISVSQAGKSHSVNMASGEKILGGRVSHAPARWSEIVRIATARGAQSWAIRKWLQRGEIPASWKLRIFNDSNGGISFEDMMISCRK